MACLCVPILHFSTVLPFRYGRSPCVGWDLAQFDMHTLNLAFVKYCNGIGSDTLNVAFVKLADV